MGGDPDVRHLARWWWAWLLVPPVVLAGALAGALVWSRW